MSQPDRPYPPRSLANPNAPQRDMRYAHEVLAQNRRDAIEAKRQAAMHGTLPKFLQP